MATYLSQTIRKTIDDIKSGKLVIPALQRNFVWPEEKIIDLFDSLIKGYPIGTFLFWDVSEDAFNSYSFNKILFNLKETRNKKYRGEPAESGRTEYSAVLDGQQRITSLAIGIMGKYSFHKKGTAWASDLNYTDKYLCINILHRPADIDEKYELRFMPSIDIRQIKEFDEIDEETNQPIKRYEYWVKVSDVYDDNGIVGQNAEKLFGFIMSLEQLDPAVFTYDRRNFIHTLLTSLRNVLTEKEVISVYTTPSNLSLPEVVDIFVRVNSGGEKLDDADLILSIASGESEEESFYDKISESIDEIQTAANKEFKCDKKYILSLALLCVGANSLSLKKPENYSRQMITRIIDAWDAIIEKTKGALVFIEKLGFDVGKISTSLVIPVAYYFYKTNRGIDYYDSVTSKYDRVYIRQWIFRTIINGVFDEGTGASMLRIRTLIDEACDDGLTYYPLDRFIEKAIKKPLLVSDEQISDIFDWKYPDPRIKPLLMELSPSIPNNEYTMDHIWPKTILTSKSRLRALTPNKTDIERNEFQNRCHYLPNIQLLTSNENSQKLETQFASWIDSFYSNPSTRMALYDRNLIPNMDDYGFEHFIEFFDARSELIRKRIKEAFPDSFEAIRIRYGFT